MYWLPTAKLVFSSSATDLPMSTDLVPMIADGMAKSTGAKGARGDCCHLSPRVEMYMFAAVVSNKVAPSTSRKRR